VKYTHILLDMDEVLAGFAVAALRAHRRLDMLARWPTGVWDMVELLKLSHEAFWARLNTRDFWLNQVRPYPYAREFVQNLVRLGYRVTACSVPSGDVAVCRQAKRDWLAAHISEHLAATAVFPASGDEKLQHATDASVLIDDNPKTVECFRTSGRAAIMVPSVHNQIPGYHDAYSVNYLQLLERLWNLEREEPDV